MHVLFLEIETERDWAVASIGPAFLGAYLRAHGHQASAIQVGRDESSEEIVRRIRTIDPGMLGLSMTTRQWLRGRDVVANVRLHLDIPVVAGGLHPTFAPEGTLACPGFDYVCLGEGEAALLELCEVVEQRGRALEAEVLNIQVAGGARPEVRPPIEPIDGIPFMARDLLNEQYGVRHMVTQRGCPFPCTYCAARMYNDMYTGYGRRRSHENVEAELGTLVGEQRGGGLSYIIFLDDTFTINPKWVKEFCAIRGTEQRPVGFSLHARVETVNPQMLGQLARAGCKHITFGVESGSERVRRDIMKRHVSNQRLIEAFAWSRDVGIITTANYILGVPGETREDLEMTLALHDELKPHDFGYFVFYPYPGTPLFKTCKDMGILPDDWMTRAANHRETILNLPDLTQDDLTEFYDRFTATREASYMARYGTGLSDSSKAAVREHVEASAACG